MGCANPKRLLHNCISSSNNNNNSSNNNSNLCDKTTHKAFNEVIVANYPKKHINNVEQPTTSKNTFNDFFSTPNQSPTLFNAIPSHEPHNTIKEKHTALINNNNNATHNNNNNNDEHKLSKKTSAENLSITINNIPHKPEAFPYSNYLNNSTTKINITPPSSTNIPTKIEFPKAIFKFYNNSKSNLLEEISLTPNSLTKTDGTVLIQPKYHKFSFGNSKDNDCELTGANLADKQFYVYFDSDSKKFSAIDNIAGTGLFVKIEDNIIINHDMIVSFCADHMYLQVIDGKVCGGKTINIKFLQSLNKTETHVNSNQKNVLTIGRGNKCDIVHNDESVSKIHCTIKYEGNEWVLYDGVVNEKEHKKSTNGLWLLANMGMELKDKMTMKTGIYKIIVEIKENS